VDNSCSSPTLQNQRRLCRSRKFKENNETVAQRIAMTRIARSATMLENDKVNGVTITEIAFASGFRDLTTFERAFCAVNGMTPSAWRRRAHSHAATAASTVLGSPVRRSARAPSR
jgi:AraC-like DNA-binding protein